MKKLAILGTIAVLLVGCGDKVEVPPAHVGKIMTRYGYQPEIINTSKFRLDPCWAYCDKLVTLDASDKTTTENLEIFMPTDKLVLNVGVRTTLSVNHTKVENLFDTLSPEATANGEGISWNRVYDTYAKQVILTETREYLSQYSISEVASSMEKVNSDLRKILTKTISERTPFNVSYVGITNIQYPEVITNAQVKAAERREAIQQEDAQLQIAKVRLERELQEARLQRQIDFEKAEGEAAAQTIQKEVVDTRVLELRRLENAKLWIEKWDGQLPKTALGDNVPMIQLSK